MLSLHVQVLGRNFILFGLILQEAHLLVPRTGALSVQVLGRNFILFGLILQEPRLQERPVVFYLFLVWGAVELVRYPYYVLQSAGREVPVVTWLRYTAWIPLYPLGILLEGQSGHAFFKNSIFTVFYPFVVDWVLKVIIYRSIFTVLPGTVVAFILCYPSSVVFIVCLCVNC